MSEKKSWPIGGWLYLVGLYVLLIPPTIAAYFIPLYFGVFFEGIIDAKEVGSIFAREPHFAYSYLGIIVFYLLYLACSIYQFWLFICKRRTFPKVFIAIEVLFLIGYASERGMLRDIGIVSDADTSSGMAILFNLVLTVVVCIYLLVGKRPKQTFIH